MLSHGGGRGTLEIVQVRDKERIGSFIKVL